MLRLYARLLCCLVLFVPAAFAAPPVDLDAPLPVDQSIHYRVLPNGMRYWIRPNTPPAGKVSMWLRVGSGSLNESDEQRGLAHLLEHLAFNGSQNFPAGTLIKRFEAAGLTFGAHQNATTGFLDTVYKLTVPNNPETLDLGLLYFSDVAHRLTIDDQEVARERNVVLAERTARDNAASRAFNKQLLALVPGSRFGERMPLGDAQAIANATAAQLRAYYEKWYRPDNTVLLVAGDLDVEALDKLVRKHFSDWKPVESPARDHSPDIRPYTADRAEVISEYGLFNADLNVARLDPPRDFRNERGYREWLVHRFGRQIINARLRDLILEGRTRFGSAWAAGDSSFGTTLVEVHARSGPEEWKTALRELLLEIKRARVHGFGDAEFAYAREVVRTEVERDAFEEADTDALRWLKVMEAAIDEGRRPMGARQELELFRRLLPTIRRAEVEAAVRARHAPERRTFTLALPRWDGHAAPTTDEVLAVVRAADAEIVARLPDRKRATMLLAKDPTPAAVAERTHDPDLDVVSATLENGVRVHIRPLRYKNEQVSVRITLAGGRLAETPENHGISEVAALPFKVPSSANLGSVDLRRILATKHFSLSGRDTAGGIELDLTSPRRDLEDGFRLAHLLLTQARIEPAVFDMWKRQASERQANREGSVDAQLNDRVDALLTSNDARFQVLTPKEVERLTLAAGQTWLDGMLKHSPIEVAIVGDLTHDQAIALAAKYLGSLPERGSIKNAYERARTLNAPAGPHQALVRVDTATPRAMVYVGWRGPDWQDVHDWQVLDLAGRILSSRLLKEVREQRGLAYSLRARASANTLYRGNGRFRVSFATDPLKAEEAADVVQRVVDEFVANGPTPEELTTAREQASLSFRSGTRAPEFWLDVLGDLEYMGADLTWVKRYVENVERYTREDLIAVLKKYIRPDRMVRVIGAPIDLPRTGNEAAQAPVATIN